MIAIDDSESMRTNGAGRLALEAMVVLCKALTQLEVGQLAVVSFGDEVRLLHAFDRPFTDASGAHTISQFSFQQAKTHWPRFLESAVAQFAQAKHECAGAGDELLQLAFIISDARVQQDRETVARWTREAAERRQLLVLIVIDSTGGNEANSILKLQSVTYPGGKIKVVKYLENFPFPYYVILSQLAELPEIVADALRQFFELVNGAR